MSMERPRAPEVGRLVVIGSLNPAKTMGVKRVFSELFYDVRFAEVSTSSVVKVQPIGIEEVLTGATKRARHALSEESGDFGVGIEAGLFQIAPEQHINIQVAVVVDREGRSGSGLSCGFPLPEDLVRRMKADGEELDGYARELTGAPRIREEDGIVYHLTRGRVSRVEMTEQCVRMALVPWLNRKQYGF